MEIAGISNATTTISFRDSITGDEISLPCGPGAYQREHDADTSQLVDIMLHRDVCLYIGLRIEIAIRSDGSVWFCGTTPIGHENTYWHFAREWSAYHPNKVLVPGYRGDEARKIAAKQPTSAQLATLARWYLGLDVPFGLGGLGHPVCAWAFRGYTANDLSQQFGDGSPVYLTAPTPGDVDRLQEDADRIAKQEAALEWACEEGLLPGAFPADL